MAFIYDIPTDNQLSLIDKDYLDDIQMTDPIFDEFPIVNSDDHLISWEQKDNTLGLMSGRGLNGEPTAVKRLGAKRFMMEPGVYGDFLPIDELEMVRRRPFGAINGRIDVKDLVAECQMQLMSRQMNRVKWILWQLMINGAFNVTNATGAIVHRDTFKPQTFASQVLWSSFTTATPLNDFRQIQLLHRGHSTNFGSAANAYMNIDTKNLLLNNTNTADLYGRRTAGLGTFNSVAQVNSLFSGDGLPQIVEYDRTYFSDGTDGNAAGSFQLFIPYGVVVVIGKRDNGAKIGEFRMTRNASNGGAPGAYSKVIDFGDRMVPRKIEVHRGFNGGPVVFYGSSVAIMKVA